MNLAVGLHTAESIPCDYGAVSNGPSPVVPRVHPVVAVALYVGVEDADSYHSPQTVQTVAPDGARADDIAKAEYLTP